MSAHSGSSYASSADDADDDDFSDNTGRSNDEDDVQSSTGIEAEEEHVKRIAGKETLGMQIFKLAVLFTILTTAALVSAGTYVFLARQENQNYVQNVRLLLIIS
jgi:hypothetical protein